MSTADRNVALLSAGAGGSLAQELVSVWDHALAGDSSAQSGWEAEAGSEWLWQRDGVVVKHSNGEWSNLRWQQCATATLAELKNFVIEVTISGNAEAAGLSFGDFKDFLAILDAGAGPRHLQLEVDLPAERWAFRIDGQLQDRFWWDSSVRSAADLIAGQRLQLGISRGSPEQVIDGWRYFGYQPAEGQDDADMGRRHAEVFFDLLRGEGFAKPNPRPMFPNPPGLLRLEPHSDGLRERIWWGAASGATAVWTAQMGMNLMSSTLVFGESEVEQVGQAQSSIGFAA